MNLKSGIWNLRRSVTVVALCVVPVGVATAPQAAEYDVILRNGTVIDGTGHPRYRADVATRNGRIVRVGDLAEARAVVDLDVTGLYVTPGFINLHSHAVPAALPAAVNMLTQGVTTEILNADGGGAIDIAAQLRRLADAGVAVNVGAYIGFNGVWSRVVGPDSRRATDDEIATMREAIVAGLDAGAVGVSAGLDYKPAYYATTDEVVRVVEAARGWRTHFSNHERVTPDSGYSSRVGVEETITIGERSGLAPLITHMKSQGHEQGDAPTLTALMRAATERGAFTSSDLYPYLAGQTSLGALIIPAWAQDGGNEAMRARFADAAARARIVTEAEEAMDARFGGAAGVYLPASGRHLVDVMEEWKVRPGEAVVRLLEESGNQAAILTFGAESDLVELMRYPDAAIACDCGATTNTRTHPRNYGTFPRVLGRYVRDTQALTWEDAVRKMTGLPASLLGIVSRGFIAPGMMADITVFDPASVIDHATYEEPAQYSDGIRHVFVNGRFALRDGAPTGERSGAPIVRTFHMPTRPMSTGAPRRLDVAGAIVIDDGGVADFMLRLEQSADGRTTTGDFRFVDPEAGVELEMIESGLVQTAADWATWSGTARVVSSGAVRAVTVVIDRGAGRNGAGTGTTVIVTTDDGYHVTGLLSSGREAALRPA